jgi:hypothetical protein
VTTVSVVPTVEAGNIPPRVRLDVTDTGTPNLFAATVTRLNPDGTTSTVRTSDGNPLVLTTSGSNRVGLLYDYEAPFGEPVSYSTIESPAGLSAEVTVPEARVWLIHPGVPALSTPIAVASFGNRVRRVARGVHYPMGRSTPVVQTDGARKSAESSMDVRIADLTDLAALEAVTADASTLLLNIPADLQWGIPASYIAVGDTDEARLIDYAGDPNRYVTLPFTVVDMPVGGSQSERTYADVLADNATYATLRTRYPTYLALLAGP